MPLIPIDETHALQIQAGTIGRRSGHGFEDKLSMAINSFEYPLTMKSTISTHVNSGNPARLLLQYFCNFLGETKIISAQAISTGALATSEDGRHWLTINGSDVRRCKSDIVVIIDFANNGKKTFGVSTKQCNNKKPTNAQLYFTTANGFVNLLRLNSISVSDYALIGLRKFCGDAGFRPRDLENNIAKRKIDPRRYFWEEMGDTITREWSEILSQKQDIITRLLFQKAYLDDPFIPDFLIHKTKFSDSWDETEVAIYHIDELLYLSRKYQGFSVREYSVRKGTHKDPAGVVHLAPRFGIVQMQRGGQAQHPEQLQFNLEAGYFYKIRNDRTNMFSDFKSE